MGTCSVKITSASIWSFVIFIFSPTAWISFGVVEVSTNSRIGYLKLALFFGVLGFSLFPWGDGYERFKVFNKSEYFDLLGFLEFGLLQGDILFYMVSFTLKHMGIPYQFIQMIFVFTGYFLVFVSLQRLLVSFSQKDRLLVLFLILMLINFTSLSNNMRYMLGTIFFLHAVLLRECHHKNTRAYFWFILAGFTHFYAFVLLLMYATLFIASNTLKRNKLILIFIFSFIFMFFSSYIVTLVATLLSSGDGFIERKIASYLLGSDGLITKMVSSPSQIIFNSLLQIPLLMLVAFFYRYGDFNCKSTRFFLLFFSFCLSILYFYSTYMRFSYFCLLYGVFLMVRHWHLFKGKKYFLSCFIVFSFLYGSLHLIYFKRIIKHDNISYINDVSLCVIASPIFMIGNCLYSFDDIYNGNKNFRIMKAGSIERTMEVISK